MKYGLPELQIYPLNDWISVQSSIWNMRYCPFNMRTKLASNINAVLNEKGYEVECPREFKSYIDHTRVSNYVDTTDKLLILAENVDRYIKNLKISIPIKFTNIVKDISFQNYQNRMNIVFDFLKSNELLYKIEKAYRTKRDIEISSLSESLVSFCNSFEMVYELIHCAVMKQEYQSNINITFAKDIMQNYIDILIKKTGNKHNFLQYTDRAIECCHTLGSIELIAMIYHAISIEWVESGYSLINGFYEVADCDKEPRLNLSEWNEIIFSPKETEKLLNTNINKNYNAIKSLSLGSSRPIIKSFNDIMVREKLYKFESIYNMLTTDHIRSFIPLFTFDLNQKHLLILSESNAFEELYQWFMCCDNCYVGKRGTEYFILGYSKDNLNKIIAIPLENNNLLRFKKTGLKIKTFNFDIKTSVSESMTMTDNNVESITEGIEIGADGEVTFTFSPKKTFMDQYAENHRILVENNKAENYDAMKTNLAFLFAMISVIERDYIYGNKKVSKKKLEDAKKARTFAYNDFNTYIKVIQKNDRDFDFTKYYHEQGYDKMTFKVTPDTVKGIQKLFQQILLGNFLKV